METNIVQIEKLRRLNSRVKSMLFDVVRHPKFYVNFMLLLSETAKAKAIIKKMYASENLKHWTTKEDIQFIALTIHKADKLRRLSELNLETVVSSLSIAQIKGVITEDAKAYILGLMQDSMMKNNLIVENEFIKK